MLSDLSFGHVIIILAIVLLVFGAKRLPEMGAAMGKGIREFKKNISDVKTTLNEVDDEPAPRIAPRRLENVAVNEEEESEPKKLSQ